MDTSLQKTVYATWEATQCEQTTCSKCNLLANNCSCMRPMRFTKPPTRLVWIEQNNCKMHGGIRKAPKTAGKRGHPKKLQSKSKPKRNATYESVDPAPVPLKMEDILNYISNDAQPCSEMEFNLDISLANISHEELTAYLTEVENMELIASSTDPELATEYELDNVFDGASSLDSVDGDIVAFLNSLTVPDDEQSIVAIEDFDLELLKMD